MTDISRRKLFAKTLVAAAAGTLAGSKAVAATNASSSGDADSTQLHAVAFSGSYKDLIGVPDIKDMGNFLGANRTPGSAGPTANVSLSEVVQTKAGVTTPFKGSIKVPFFSVNAKGLITGYGNRTLTFS